MSPECTVKDGVFGISPEVSLMPIRFLNSNGNGDLATAVRAIDYAIAQHVDVLSASWGAHLSASEATPLIEAIQRANLAGIGFVAAAGNNSESNDDYDTFPANVNLPNVISVTSTGQQDERSIWANFGIRSVHIAAPGHDILSTLPGGAYGLLSGTSMAAPLVAGLVAFLKAQDPALTGAQARALLQVTGEKALVINACHCRIDALAAVNALLSRKLFIFPASAYLKLGETQQFRGHFGRAPYKFTLSNSSLGTISEAGLFQAVQAGTTTVTVADRDGNQATSFNVDVLPTD